jgi:hypothetical protein
MAFLEQGCERQRFRRRPIDAFTRSRSFAAHLFMNRFIVR